MSMYTSVSELGDVGLITHVIHLSSLLAISVWPVACGPGGMFRCMNIMLLRGCVQDMKTVTLNRNGALLNDQLRFKMHR